MTLVMDHLREFVVEHPKVENLFGDLSIVKVRRHHERIFVRELRGDGIGYYYPLKIEKRYRNGHKIDVRVPMFPGKIFVANGADGRSAVTKGVAGMCVTNNCFVRVAQSYQSKLRLELMQLQTLLQHQPEADPFPELLPGREVQVPQGIDHWAAGYRGKIVRRQGREMFVIVIEILGREVEVEDFRGELLEVIEAAA